MVSLNSLPLDKVWTAVKRVLCFFGVFVLIIVGVTIGRLTRPSAPSNGSQDGLLGVYVEQLDGYKTRLVEVEKGLSWYKKLSEKQVKPTVVTNPTPPDTVWRTNFFPLPEPTGIDSSFIDQAFDFEYPFFFRRRVDSLYVSTFNRTRNEINLYAFGGIGRQLDIAISPTKRRDAVAIFTSRDWVIFNGFGLGGGMSYDLIRPQPYLSAKTRITLFKIAEIELGTAFPLGAKLDVHYRF